MNVLIVPTLLLTGCFQVTVRPSCEEVDVLEVADDEPTAAGTARELLDTIELDDVLPATWQDGSATEADVVVARGTGSATWVQLESTSVKTRSFGFGRNTLAIFVVCEDQLQVPIDAEVASADGTLQVSVSGLAVTPTPFTEPAPGSARLNLTGDFGDAVFPATDDDPDDFTDLYSFVNLVYEDDVLREGSAGWGGEQSDANSVSASAEYVLDFGVDLQR
jgi:hypothetical protein